MNRADAWQWRRLGRWSDPRDPGTDGTHLLTRMARTARITLVRPGRPEDVALLTGAAQCSVTGAVRPVDGGTRGPNGQLYV
jgi:hypothetical protein